MDASAEEVGRQTLDTSGGSVPGSGNGTVDRHDDVVVKQARADDSRLLSALARCN